MAYICPLSLYYHSTAYKAYLAVYYSDDKLTSILSDNLSLEGSVSYIVNERDAIVATSDLSLSGSTNWLRHHQGFLYVFQ